MLAPKGVIGVVSSAKDGSDLENNLFILVILLGGLSSLGAPCFASKMSASKVLEDLDSSSSSEL